MICTFGVGFCGFCVLGLVVIVALLFDCVWYLLVRYCVCFMVVILRIFVVWLLVLGLLISHVCLVLGSGGFGFFGLFGVVLLVG